MLLPSGQVIPGLLPCAEEAEKRVVRISLWDGCAAPHPHPDPHLPVGRAPTSELLHRHVPPRALGQLGRPTEGLNPCQQCVPVQLTITQPQGLNGKQIKPKGRDVKMLKELWLKVRRQTRTFLL